MTHTKKTMVGLAVGLLAAASASASVSLLAPTDYASLSGTNNYTTAGGVTFTSVAGNMITKSSYGVSGIGITGGRTSDEIDIDETLSLSFAATQIESFSVSFLYNGSEFSDWAEIAQVKAFNGANAVGVGTLQVHATDDTTAFWVGTGFGSVANLSPAADGQGGAWLVTNPFGATAITRLEFTALASDLCGYGVSQRSLACTNQSDFALSSVAAVPEPETYALMLAGLAAMGFVARRRKA